MDAKEIQSIIIYHLEQAARQGEKIESAIAYEVSGIQTTKSGLAIRTTDGSEFQITIVQSK